MEGLNLTPASDGKGYNLEWDKTDPDYAFLNGLTDKQIETIVRHATYLANHPDEEDISETIQQIIEEDSDAN